MRGSPTPTPTRATPTPTTICSGALSGPWVVEPPAAATTTCRGTGCGRVGTECVCVSATNTAALLPVGVVICHEKDKIDGRWEFPPLTTELHGSVTSAGEPGVVGDVVVFDLTIALPVDLTPGCSSNVQKTTISALGTVTTEDGTIEGTATWQSELSKQCGSCQRDSATCGPTTVPFRSTIQR